MAAPTCYVAPKTDIGGNFCALLAQALGGLSGKLSLGLRMAFLPCLLRMDRLAAALLVLLRRMLESYQALRRK